MADEGGEQQKGQRKGKRKPGKKARGVGRGKKPGGRERAILISAIAHPLRRRVMRLIRDSGEARSPVELAKDLQTAVGSISYHVNVLRECHAVKPVGEQLVRGAVEHFYESAIEDDPPIEALLEETQTADEEDA